MARPRPDLPEADALRALVDAKGCLAVRVTPGARSEGISIRDGSVSVKVRAKPQDGAANAAVEKLVAQALGLPPTSCSVVRGGTSRDKLLQLYW